MSEPSDKSWILNEVGLCLMSLGRLGEAAPFYERANADHAGAGRLAQRQHRLPEPGGAARPPRRARRQRRRRRPRRWPWPAARRTSRMSALRWPTRPGPPTCAATWRRPARPLQQAEALEREIDSSKRYLYSLARHPARRPPAPHRPDSGLCPARHRGQPGDLRAQPLAQRPSASATASWATWTRDEGNHESARAHYDQALQDRARHHPPPGPHRGAAGPGALGGAPPRPDRFRKPVRSGLHRPQRGPRLRPGRRLPRLRGRSARGPGLGAPGGGALPSPAGEGPGVRADSLARARAEANRARQMSEEMGYHWGRVDAEEVMEEIGRRE